MDVQRFIIVVDDSVSSRRSSSLLVDGRIVGITFLSSDDTLSTPQLLEGASVVAINGDTVPEEKVPPLLKLINGKAPFVVSRSPLPLKRIGKLALEEGGEEKETEENVLERLMKESLEYYQLASVYQKCLKIITSYDYEKLLSTISDTFMHELKVDSCVLWLAEEKQGDEYTIASVRGLITIDAEGSRFSLTKMDFFEEVNNLYPFEFAPEGEKNPFLYVPLAYGGFPIGLVKLGRKLSGKPYTQKDRALAKVIADHSAFALKNLEKIQRLEKVTLLDPETKVYSETFFRDFFMKEAAKSERFKRPLTLVHMVIENYSFLISRAKETVVHEKLSDILAVVGQTLRDSDIISRLDSNRFCILLPETDYLGGLITIRRLRKAMKKALSFEYFDRDLTFEVVMRAVSFPSEGRTLEELSEKAEQKFLAFKRSTVSKYRLYDRELWDIFDVIFGPGRRMSDEARGKNGKGPRVRSDFGRNRYFYMSADECLKFVEVVAHDLAIDRETRGIIVVAGPRPELVRQALATFDLSEVSGKKVYILGTSVVPKMETGNIIVVPTGDSRLDRNFLLVYLKETGAYAVLGRIEGDRMWGFNTSDEVLVEILYEKVQELYLIQGGF
ncbi:MAG: diguanylate cyclase [Deltaproteobacteria bacterium]|nr:MAG: diguanylate cyclase [Deltaproteobacteria bacterium]